MGIYAVIDMLNVEDVLAKLKSLKDLPDVVILHEASTKKAAEPAT